MCRRIPISFGPFLKTTRVFFLLLLQIAFSASRPVPCGFSGKILLTSLSLVPAWSSRLAFLERLHHGDTNMILIRPFLGLSFLIISPTFLTKIFVYWTFLSSFFFFRVGVRHKALYRARSFLLPFSTPLCP